jgi:uncharacterized membrane protein
MRTRLLNGIALLSTGLLAGAFGYGAVSLVSAFNNVPLDVRLTFHTALMHMNGLVMQSTMGAAAISTLALAALSRGRRRLLAAAAGVLVAGSFLITRLGNVPINAKIKVWAVSTPPPGYADLLDTWENYNVARTLTALTAFVLIVGLTLYATGRERQA